MLIKNQIKPKNQIKYEYIVSKKTLGYGKVLKRWTCSRNLQNTEIKSR